jgi:hypothetical protein
LTEIGKFVIFPDLIGLKVNMKMALSNKNYVIKKRGEILKITICDLFELKDCPTECDGSGVLKFVQSPPEPGAL